MKRKMKLQKFRIYIHHKEIKKHILLCLEEIIKSTCVLFIWIVLFLSLTVRFREFPKDLLFFMKLVLNQFPIHYHVFEIWMHWQLIMYKTNVTMKTFWFKEMNSKDPDLYSVGYITILMWLSIVIADCVLLWSAAF